MQLPEGYGAQADMPLPTEAPGFIAQRPLGRVLAAFLVAGTLTAVDAPPTEAQTGGEAVADPSDYPYADSDTDTGETQYSDTYQYADAIPVPGENDRWYVDKNGNGEFDEFEDRDHNGLLIKQCQSYVISKLEQEIDFQLERLLGTPNEWAENAAEMGYEVDGIPEVGDVAVLTSAEAGTDSGHVEYVEAVHDQGTADPSDDTVTTSDYNGSGGPGQFGVEYDTTAFTYINFRNRSGSEPTDPPTAEPTEEPSEPVPEPAEVIRLAGADRIATAVVISEEREDQSADAVVIAGANGLPDALTGGPLAAYLTQSGIAETATESSGPVLLAYPAEYGGLPDITRTELTRVLRAGGRVVILGGDSVVAPSVEQELQDLGIVPEQIERFAGATRFDTANMAAMRFRSNGLEPMGIVSVDGNNIGLTITAANLANRLGMPLVLENGNDSVQLAEAGPSPYLDGRASRDGLSIYAVGLRALQLAENRDVYYMQNGGEDMEVISVAVASDNIVETNVMAANVSSDSMAPTHSISYADLVNPVDAITGAARRNEVLLLGRTNFVFPAVEQQISDMVGRNPALGLYIFGGTQAVSQGSEELLTQIIRDARDQGGQ